MYKYLMSRTVNEKGLIGIGMCIIAFIVGQLILNRISTMENPPMGNTVYILIGSAFRYTSILCVVLILKYLYDNKRKVARRQTKRKGHKLYYLKNKDKEAS